MERSALSGKTAPRADMPRELLALAATLVASVVLAFLVTRDGVLTVAFAGGLAALSATAFAAVRYRSDRAGTTREPDVDWSLVLGALDQTGLGIAIVDRANRLVCASSIYQDRFGTAAPPRLELDDAALERLARLTHTAWREGSSGPARVEDAGDAWTVAARTAGAGEEYLVWQFVPEGREGNGAAIEPMWSGRLAAAFDRAGIAAVLVQADGTIEAANAAFAGAALGDAEAEPEGRSFADQLRSDEHEQIFFTREGRAGVPHLLLEVPLAEHDEAARLMLLFAQTAAMGGGAGEGGGASQLEALIEHLPLGLAAVKRDGRFLLANAAFRRAVGLAGTGSDEPLPPFPSDLVAPENKSALADAVRRCARGGSEDLTVRLRANPEEPVSWSLAGVRGLGEAALLVSLSDNSEENRLKRQVVQAMKMQAIGQLAGGVAHDFNNVLTAVIGTCDLMLERHVPGDGDHEDIIQIRSNSDRAASLTRQLLAFSRQQTLQPKVIQLPDVVTGMMPLLERLTGARIALEVHHERDLGPVRVDPGQIERVIMNLAVNSRDAIHEHGGGEQAAGTVRIATRRMDADGVPRLGNEMMPQGDYTVLVVEDTGGGIPRRLLSKIFEPFFTTKEQGKGTGLGLATAYGIVKQSGGFIFAENAREQAGATRGARFTIYLPVHDGPLEEPHRAPLPSAAAAAEENEVASGGARILLVEDEDMVRAIAERTLARAGHTITAVRDGEEGIEAFQTGGPFDLVVSDVVMPGIGGPAMARALREAAPEVPILFMSGYAEAQLREEIDFGAMHFIAKPFSVREITDAVAEALRERVAKG